MFKRAALFAVALALSMTAAQAVNLPPLTFWDPTNALGTFNSWVTGVLNPGVTPGSTAPLTTGRNLLDNGAMWITQRGVGNTATAATTSGCAIVSYGPDRWCADVNMASGAGQLATVTSSPTPPPGFVNTATLVRNSGALLQPQCALQELPTLKATQAAGQTANLSIYAEALAGLNADNGNNVNLYLITGTGAGQGLGALRSAVGMTTTVKASSFTISTSTGLITNTTSVVAGQPVTITAATIPTGIVAGQTYYVSSALLNSGTAFAIAPTYANAIAGTNTVVPSSGGTTDVINVSYITPVWTGLAVYGANGAGQGQTSAAQAFGQAASNPFTLSSSAWTRIQTGPINIPTGVTEAAVAICFHPAGTGSGSSTDGIAFTGAQLELMGPNQTAAGSYEFKDPVFEQQVANRYYYGVFDAAAHTALTGTGDGQSTTVCIVPVQFPVPMDVAPTFGTTGTISSSTFKVLTGTTETTLSALAQPSTNETVNSTIVGAVAATTTGQTAGAACLLTGQTASTTASFAFSADF